MPQFRQYLLRERGITPLQTRAVIAIMYRLCRFLNDEQLTRMNTEKIRGFLVVTSRERGWSPRTFRNARQNLKCFFNWAHKQGIIRRNPVELIERPKIPRCLPRFLTRQEADRIMDQIRWVRWNSDAISLRNETLIATFLFSGLRLREALSLQLADVNLDLGTIRVRKGKGQKDRIIPIHRQLRPLLARHCEDIKNSDAWIFTGYRSCKPLSPRDVYRICRRISTGANVKFTPHMLRHTFARLLVEADFNLFKLKELLGHSDISTTQIYLSVASERLAQSLNQVDIL